jgi:hypothetical protein
MRNRKPVALAANPLWFGLVVLCTYTATMLIRLELEDWILGFWH